MKTRTHAAAAPPPSSTARWLREAFWFTEQLRHHQLPLWPAIWMTALRVVRDPLRLGIGFFFGLGFAVITSLIYRSPAMNITVAFMFALAITFTSTMPWRLRLARRGPVSIVRLVILNGTLSIIAGFAAFYVVLIIAALIIYGWSRTQELLPSFARIAVWGFTYSMAGLPMILSEESDRASRRAAHQRERLERLAEEARLVALRAQINPHFFFNALNSIAALIPTRPQDAERSVELLAEALRPVLTHDQPMDNSIEAEVAVARAYAEIELLRLGERLRIEFVIAEGVRAARVPSLCLQPLIENAIVHGASRSSEAFAIRMVASQLENGIRIEVLSAPMRLFDFMNIREMAEITPHSGHALHNIQARLRALFGGDSELKAWVGSGGEAIVRLHVSDAGPVIRASAPAKGEPHG